MLSHEQADSIAHAWIDAWNAHDLDRIMRPYTDDIEFIGPFVAALLDDLTGTGIGTAPYGYTLSGVSRNTRISSFACIRSSREFNV